MMEEENKDPLETEVEVQTQSNEGWADIMQKILRSKKPKRKKTVVLAKAKKLSSVKVKDETEESNVENEPTEPKLRKVDWLGKGRTKPNPLDRNREKHLQKIAVRGVIQLFNAVNQLQKNVGISTPSSFKEDKKLKSINKNAFLDILYKGKDGSKTETSNAEETHDIKSEDESIQEEDTGKWNALKNNFMTSSKLSNWDKVKEAEVNDNI